MTDDSVSPGWDIVTRRIAKTLGVARYFTGKPCCNGHLTQRNTKSGRCLSCGRLSSNANHHAHREVKLAKMRAYQAAHKEQRAAWDAAYRKANEEKISKVSRLYRAKNKEASVAKSRDYYEKNKDRISAYRAAYRAANKQKMRARDAAWRSANREKKSASAHARTAREVNAEGKYTAADLKRIFAAQKGKCAYCRVKVGVGYHIDHIMPLFSGGSNWPSNIQITCSNCNLSKRAMHPIDFARKKGFLI